MPNWKKLFIAGLMLVIAAIVWLLVGIAIVSWLPLSGELTFALGAGWLIASGLGVTGARELLSRLMHPGDHEHREAQNRAGVAESERVTLMAKAWAALMPKWQSAEGAKLDRDAAEASAQLRRADDLVDAVIDLSRAEAQGIRDEGQERLGRAAAAYAEGRKTDAEAQRIDALGPAELMEQLANVGVLIEQRRTAAAEATEAEVASEKASERVEVDLDQAREMLTQAQHENERLVEQIRVVAAEATEAEAASEKASERVELELDRMREELTRAQGENERLTQLVRVAVVRALEAENAAPSEVASPELDQLRRDLADAQVTTRVAEEWAKTEQANTTAALARENNPEI